MYERKAYRTGKFKLLSAYNSILFIHRQQGKHLYIPASFLLLIHRLHRFNLSMLFLKVSSEHRNPLKLVFLKFLTTNWGLIRGLSEDTRLSINIKGYYVYHNLMLNNENYRILHSKLATTPSLKAFSGI